MPTPSGPAPAGRSADVNRRQFLVTGAVTAAAVTFAACDATIGATPKSNDHAPEHAEGAAPNHNTITPPKGGQTMEPYKATDFAGLLGMQGFSNNLLNDHFKLYGGYVANTNKILEALAAAAKTGDYNSPATAELRRRLGWEFDGMRLHELYFGNLGGKASMDAAGKLAAALTASFGSVEAWTKEFKGIGATRGIGWVVLYQDPATGRLVNVWINEHDGGHLAGGKPLLIMDVFEHAFWLDYRTDKAAYIEAFMKNVNWAAVEVRL